MLYTFTCELTYAVVVHAKSLEEARALAYDAAIEEADDADVMRDICVHFDFEGCDWEPNEVPYNSGGRTVKELQEEE